MLPDASAASRVSSPQLVSIRPGPAVLSVLRHLNYKPWFALAEFVDNALQSYLANRDALHALHGQQWRLKVAITLDAARPARITIRDNAAGIAAADFPRAFRPAVVPADASGLSEFGMGMKSAACWFAPHWMVRTKALGEAVTRTVRFDIARIVNDAIEELAIEERPAGEQIHFTEVLLDDPYHVPAGRTVGKIKDHLRDIYRTFTRSGTLELWFGEERLTFEEPTVLVAPFQRDPQGPARTWRKEINFPLGGSQSVTGFAALRDPGNHSRSGFALFRRGRLIQGSGEEGYRPPSIFGSAGSFRHLRLFGELHLEGFEVSHTKDGFRWNEDEEPFLELLKEELDRDDLPLLRQADLYRALPNRRDLRRAAEQALAHTAEALERSLPEVLPRVADAVSSEASAGPLPAQPALTERTLRFNFAGRPWVVRIELSGDDTEGEWLTLSDPPEGEAEALHIRIALAHPFMTTFAQSRADDVEALVRIGAALAVAEKLARRAGVRSAGTVRRNVNQILREALSSP